MGVSAAKQVSQKAFHLDQIEFVAETYGNAPIEYIQTTSGQLGAAIYSTSAPRVDVRQASFRAGVLITMDIPIRRFSMAVGVAGRAQLLRTNLTNSNVGYMDGVNGAVARLEPGTTWCNVTIDAGLLQQVATTHDYHIPGGDHSCGMPFLSHAALAKSLSQIARSPLISECSSALFEDEIALVVLRALNRDQPRGKPYRSKHWLAVHRVIDFIRANFADDLTMTGLCQIAGVGEWTLQHIFRDVTGLSVQQYLKSYRLHAARAMLREGRVGQVKDAARACGLPHAGHFSQYFKALFGELPGELLSA